MVEWNMRMETWIGILARYEICLKIILKIKLYSKMLYFQEFWDIDISVSA